MWDWITDTVDSITDGIGDAWEWINDQVDYYIYDGSDNQAIIEKWVSDTIDTYIWDTSEDTAVIEQWVRDTFDVPDAEGWEFIDDAVSSVNSTVDDYVYNITNYIDNTRTTIFESYDDLVDQAKQLARDAVGKGSASIELLGISMKSIFDTISVDLGIPLLSLEGSMSGLLARFNNLTDLFDGFVNVDEDKLIQGAIDMAKTQKKISERLAKEVE